jgi:peroxidase
MNPRSTLAKALPAVVSARRRGPTRARRILIGAAALALVSVSLVLGTSGAQAAVSFPIEPLNGAGNNIANPTWGQAGQAYPRVAAANYADGRSQQPAGPNARYISNRVSNDLFQNVFSEHRVSQWGWAWGQFIDHTIGLAVGGTEVANIPFNSSDPLEDFTDTLGTIPFTRDAAAAGTGVNNARQAVNSTNSYISAAEVYGPDNTRLEWLRDGPVDGNLANNAATLMMPGGYLPKANSRGNASTAPTMAVDGRLLANPGEAAVAGDVRANENIGLTATQTLFAREHNRIVSLLPNTLSAEDKFQIARRVVVAEEQYITYNEFLPAMGVFLPQYTGYNPNVNAAETLEFATVGYRAHSQIHGEFTTASFPASRWTAAQQSQLKAQGVEITPDGSNVTLTIPLNVAFFNPDLLQLIGEGPMLSTLSESQYRNDELFDNGMRSVLFQVPTTGSDPTCVDQVDFTPCFTGVTDLAAIDIQRGRDHGMPTYNQLRQAYGLAPKTSFTAITGESTDQFPAGSGVDNPNSLTFTSAADINGTPMATFQADGTTSVTRASTLAARLRAVYGGNVNAVDAFVGLIAEPHLPGSEMGELQTAMWVKQFSAFRDGDRFFYGNDQGLSTIKSTYGIDFHTTLGQVIARDSDDPQANINPDVFLVADDDLPAATCSVNYQVTTTWSGQFQVNMKVTNLTNTPISNWTLGFQLPGGQRFVNTWNGNYSQNGANVTVTPVSSNTTLPAGGNYDGAGFNATWDNATNPLPVNFTVNGKRCALG